MFKIKLSEIQNARDILKSHLSVTPLIYNSWLSEELSCQVYLKLESMQPVGSFKIRGATYKISQLSALEKKRGVIAASAGNHAQGVAWGSQKLGTSALIVMPKGAAITKIQNTQALGAEIHLEGETYDEAYQAALRIAKKTKRIFVHAFEDDKVIAGQGTVGIEILEQLPDVDVVIGAIGGGGLMAGVGSAIKKLRPQVTLVGCQASGAPSMVRAVRSGKQVKLSKVDTFADGIKVVQSSEKLRKILTPLIDHWVTADDEQIAAAVLTLMEKAKVIAEGAAALSLASLDLMKKKFKNKKVVLLICGGNIDVNVLGRIIERGLIRAGRRLRINVLLMDRPGSLARLTELIAGVGANILQAIHDRSEPFTAFDQTAVALTLETRGVSHSHEVLKALRDHVLRLDVIHD